MICGVCRGSAFYEDDESALFFCSRCNTQSQELFAESFEMDNHNMLQTDGARIRFTKKSSRKRKAVETAVWDPPETAGYLHVYQAVLRLVVDAVAPLARCDGMEAAVRRMWFEYLERWRISGHDILTSFCASEVAGDVETYFGKNSFPHPIFPTQRLLYGFVALALRLLGSWAVPADLARWCKQGLVPYGNTLAQLPEETRRDMTARHKRLFRYDFRHSIFLSPMNVFFHMYALAESLELTVPPLAAPLVARAFFASLGLPPACWTAFCSITQVSRALAPPSTLDLSDEHYPEHVMAACVVAVKLVRGWTSWDLCVREGALVMPSHACELDLVKRRDLDLFLERVRFVTRPAVRSEQALGLGAAVRGVAAQLRGLTHTRSESSVPGPACVLSNRTPVHASRAQEDVAYARLLGLLAPRKRGVHANSRGFCPYLRYAEHSEEPSGLLHPQYVVLLERCARHLGVSSGLLHLLVSRVDLELEAKLRRAEKEDVRSNVFRMSAYPLKEIGRRRPMVRREYVRRYMRTARRTIQRRRLGELSLERGPAQRYSYYADKTLRRLRKLGNLPGVLAENSAINGAREEEEAPPLAEEDAAEVLAAAEELFDVPPAVEPSVSQLQRPRKKTRNLLRLLDSVERGQRPASLFAPEDVLEGVEEEEDAFVYDHSLA